MVIEVTTTTKTIVSLSTFLDVENLTLGKLKQFAQEMTEAGFTDTAELRFSKVSLTLRADQTVEKDA
jgi:hypothetical protein